MQNATQELYADGVLLVDANNISLRAIYGCSPLQDANGIPTSCLMTTFRTLYNTARELNTRRAVCVWDGGRSKFRMDLYPEYKKRKEELSEEKARLLSDWRIQRELLQEYLPFLGVSQTMIERCEADDVIYRIVQQLNSSGIKTVILSTDGDFLQLVSRNCAVYNPQREFLYGPSEVFDEYGVHPSQWVSYRAMVGDSSDNIRGIDLVGPKKAADILSKYEDIPEFLESITQKDLEKKYIKNVAEGVDIIERNFKLMDLSLLPAEEIPEASIQEAVERIVDIEPSINRFTEACVEHGLMRVVEERASWNALWRE